MRRWTPGWNAAATAFLLGAAVLSGACRRDAPTSITPVVEGTNALSIQEQVIAADASIWRDEVEAQHCEATLVQLADRLRAGADKIAVLSAFAFDQIHIPRRAGPPAVLDLGIRHQSFAEDERVTLPQAGWQTALEQFRQAGWDLAQFEWQHNRFIPARNGAPARSDFTFELHGDQAAQSNRFIIRGVMELEWAGRAENETLRRVRQITISRLSLFERAGPPLFNNHLLVAPEPSRPGASVNMHPLIVTDVNGDFSEDIILPGVNKALLNNGRANFAAHSLIRDEWFFPMKDTGVMADFDGDGHLDYVGVGDLGPFAKMLVLFRGQGAVPFSIPPRAAWEQQRTAFASYRFESASAMTAGDVDGDGDLDLFVAQYRPPYVGGNLPTPFYDANDGYPSFLLLNDGRGQFQQAKGQAALNAKNRRRTLAASFADLDQDGDMDLVTLNDFSGVDLFYNDGKGLFSDETARLSHRHLFGMGHSVADFDRDGVLDLLAIGMSIPTVQRLDALDLAPPDRQEHTRKRTDMGFGNRLYLRRDGNWVEPNWAAPLARTGWSWGVTAFDTDNDGDLEVYVANGHVSGASSQDYDSHYWRHDIYLGSSREDPKVQDYLDTALAGLNSGRTSWNGFQHNVFFVDTGSHAYVNVAYLLGLAHETDCRAVVSADLNADGHPDLLVTEAVWQGSPHRMRHRLLVHLNEGRSAHHWIGARLVGTPGREVIGTTVRVFTADRTYVAQVITGDSFQSQHPRSLHFGLGDARTVTELRVTWPDGNIQRLENPDLNRYHALRR